MSQKSKFENGCLSASQCMEEGTTQDSGKMMEEDPQI